MKFYFIGEYHQKPVYYNQQEGLLLENRMDDLIPPDKFEKKMILNKFGGITGIEMIIKNYKKNEVKE